MLIVLGAARWYKRHPVRTSAPGGFVGLMEAAVMMIHDDLIKSCVGKDYKRFAPYLLTVFFFILINNLMGLVPIFPGGANVTGNIAITLLLAIATFIMTNVFGTREYWKEIFWPEVPTWLKCPVPMMPAIEFVGILTKHLALMIRLFANMISGHLLVASCLAFAQYWGIDATNKLAGIPVGALWFVFGLVLTLFEAFVAFLQAYVFAILSTVYISMSYPEE